MQCQLKRQDTLHIKYSTSDYIGNYRYRKPDRMKNLLLNARGHIITDDLQVGHKISIVDYMAST